MANEYVENRNEILGIDETTSETRRIKTDDGKIIVKTPDIGSAIGEVQAVPTANTLLARIKSLEDKINNITSGTTPVPTTLTGSSLAEQKTQANAVNGVLTFSANISTIEMYNTDVLNDGVFTINGIVINVPRGTVYKSTIGGTPGTTVTVTGATTYIISRYV